MSVNRVPQKKMNSLLLSLKLPAFLCVDIACQNKETLTHEPVLFVVRITAIILCIFEKGTEKTRHSEEKNKYNG